MVIKANISLITIFHQSENGKLSHYDYIFLIKCDFGETKPVNAVKRKCPNLYLLAVSLSRRVLRARLAEEVFYWKLRLLAFEPMEKR